MNRLRNLLLACALLVPALVVPSAPARAATCSIPYVFTDNASFVSAATTNGNNAALVACIVGIKIDETNIGPNGIYASQIVPTTAAQATFGGGQAYTFGGGLSAAGITSQGNIISNNGVLASAVGVPLQLCPNNNCSNGMSLSATGAVTLAGSLTTPLTIAAGAMTSGATGMGATAVPPMYTFTGTTLPSTAHISVTQTACTTGSTGNCTINISLTGGAAFTSTGTYACFPSFSKAAANTGTITITELTAATIAISVLGAAGSAVTYLPVVCMGY